MIFFILFFVEIFVDVIFFGILREVCEFWMLKEFLFEGLSVILFECRLVFLLIFLEIVWSLVSRVREGVGLFFDVIWRDFFEERL